MSIEGRIAIDATFNDTDSAGSVQATKTISLTSSNAYTTGKVAAYTGVIGTNAISINPASAGYRDASGNAVAISNLSRFAFVAGKRCVIEFASENTLLWANANQAVVSNTEQGTDQITITPNGAGTATYTLVLYGT
jgi:hypothetical protein